MSETEVTIKPADKVVHSSHNDEVSHNVFSMTHGREFNVRRQAPSASSTIPFDKEGTAEVHCSIHPRMKLIVHVLEVNDVSAPLATGVAAVEAGA